MIKLYDRYPEHLPDLLETTKILTAFEKTGSGRKVLNQADVRMYLFRGVKFWVKFEEEHPDLPVTLNATHLGKKRTNVWEPYANFYVAYTRPDLRRRGLASELYAHVRGEAVAAGCVRVKSLAGTRLGALFHLAHGDHFWGLTDTGMLAVDSPLESSGRVFPTDKTPMGVRKWTDEVKPFDPSEVLDTLSSTTLCYDR